MKTKSNSEKIQFLVGTAILIAIVVVLQSVASAIKIGPFTITLSLVPIIIGAFLYGPASGAILGAAFGTVVVVAVVTGADPGGNLMFQENPIITILICLLKSTIAGLVAGLIAKLFKKKNKPGVAVTLCAVLCPVINTLIFSVGVIVFFRTLLASWALEAGFESAFKYLLIGMIGVNFLVELGVTLVLTPAILTVIKAVKSRL